MEFGLNCAQLQGLTTSMLLTERLSNDERRRQSPHLHAIAAMQLLDGPYIVTLGWSIGGRLPRS